MFARVINKSRIDSNGKPYKVVKFATDITEQKVKNSEFEGKLESISKSQAVIEFNLDGTIITANENFTSTVGYSLDEIVGKHHRIFCEDKYSNTESYREFWQNLNKGKFDLGEYKRIGKNGKEIWIQASYNPILDPDGKPYKVVKFATDVTEQKIKNAEFEGKLKSIDKVQAIIEFNLDGTIITANENFTSTVGYSLDEIVGKHHRMFCDLEYSSSSEYQLFWEKLNRGEYDAGEYRRLGKGAKEVWIQASYNPILDAEGKPYKVVKFATDITKLKDMLKTIELTSENLNAETISLTATAQQMSSSANDTNSKSQSVASAAEQLATGIRVVATNTEQMVASIKEISRSANDSANMSKETLEKAKQTNIAVSQLGNSSKEIGNVVKVISSIAQQTNLLALNATIEAARAGDAGKGFAVVANEVKELANQTALATEDITQKISAIQNDSEVAIGDIQVISDAIEKLNQISGAIATSVEEQNATTAEVSRVVTESTKGIEEISKSVREVSSLAEQNKEVSNSTLNSSKELSELSDKLKEHMNLLSNDKAEKVA